MKKYKAFLFDLDDTLLDFHQGEQKAFIKTLETFQITGSHQEAYQFYKEENLKLWVLHEQGKADQKTVRFDRFDQTIQHFNWSASADDMSQFYVEQLPKMSEPAPHALEMLKFLSAHAEIGIVTNGFSQIQKQKIRNSGIEPYIDFMISSDEANSAKPQPHMFDLAFGKLQNPKSTTLFIGDRPSSDILGAFNYGMDSCWYNPDSHVFPTNIQAKPTYEIKCLSELKVNLFEAKN